MMPFASTAREFLSAIISDFHSVGAAFAASRTETNEKKRRAKKHCTVGVRRKKTSRKTCWKMVCCLCIRWNASCQRDLFWRPVFFCLFYFFCFFLFLEKCIKGTPSFSELCGPVWKIVFLQNSWWKKNLCCEDWTCKGKNCINAVIEAG